jgi:hypothetical protein
MSEIKSTFTVKESSIGPPDIYLNAQCSQVAFQNKDGSERKTWIMSSQKYVKEAV